DAVAGVLVCVELGEANRAGVDVDYPSADAWPVYVGLVVADERRREDLLELAKRWQGGQRQRREERGGCAGQRRDDLDPKGGPAWILAVGTIEDLNGKTGQHAAVHERRLLAGSFVAESARLEVERDRPRRPHGVRDELLVWIAVK